MARRFLISRQFDLDEKGKQDNPLDGGIGYGDDKGMHADISNTHFALEALYYSQALLADKGDAGKSEPQLNFGAAIDFIQRCQNRPESNKSPWVSKDPDDAGGFIYNPVETRGPEAKNADGTVALRSLRQHQLRGPAELHLRRRGQGRPPRESRGRMAAGALQRG